MKAVKARIFVLENWNWVNSLLIASWTKKISAYSCCDFGEKAKKTPMSLWSLPISFDYAFPVSLLSFVLLCICFDNMLFGVGTTDYSVPTSCSAPRWLWRWSSCTPVNCNKDHHNFKQKWKEGLKFKERPNSINIQFLSYSNWKVNVVFQILYFLKEYRPITPSTASFLLEINTWVWYCI